MKFQSGGAEASSPSSQTHSSPQDLPTALTALPPAHLLEAWVPQSNPPKSLLYSLKWDQGWRSKVRVYIEKSSSCSCVEEGRPSEEAGNLSNQHLAPKSRKPSNNNICLIINNVSCFSQACLLTNIMYFGHLLISFFKLLDNCRFTCSYCYPVFPVVTSWQNQNTISPSGIDIDATQLSCSDLPSYICTGTHLCVHVCVCVCARMCLVLYSLLTCTLVYSPSVKILNILNIFVTQRIPPAVLLWPHPLLSSPTINLAIFYFRNHKVLVRL